ncbi:MAG: PilZ domain-containing protein, partial [Deltaproteobacteria bacterium]
EADLIFDKDMIKGNIHDISLSGASMQTTSSDLLVPGMDINLFIKLPDYNNDRIIEVGMSASVVRVLGDEAPFKCIIEFHPEKHSQQQIAYYINQRQVEIIKELKDIDA